MMTYFVFSFCLNHNDFYYFSLRFSFLLQEMVEIPSAWNKSCSLKGQQCGFLFIKKKTVFLKLGVDSVEGTHGLPSKFQADEV